MNSKMISSNNDPKLTLTSHILELRKRLIISLAALFFGVVFCFFWGQELLFELLMAPLQRLNQELVLIAVTEGFYFQIKIAFLGGIFLALPVIMWQSIAFILPALYSNERKVFWTLFITTVVLFGVGVVFAYTVVLDLALKFLLLEFNAGLNTMLSASKYLSFIVAFLLPFGLIFEIPVLVLLLTKMKLITPAQLRKKRRYIILAIFILAAILTPPDVISQVLLALPMLLLYEISILVSYLFSHDK
jgi:sec-independent protein translocase protein TatC